jgi:hypothetical protein
MIRIVKTMSTVFFADVLGFSEMASAPGAQPAVDALADLARLFSRDPLARYLAPSAGWSGRYGLSDSMFLVAEDPAAACAAAAEFCFNLAFYNSGLPSAVLVRGAIASGEVHVAPPLFPETGRANLVGDAVVRAVLLEKSGARGPRLLVSEEVAEAVRGAQVGWLLEPLGAAEELLWPLPPDPAAADGDMIAAVAQAAVGLFERHTGAPRVAAHYVGYIDLVTRALLRLKARNATAAETALRDSGLERVREKLEDRSIVARLEELRR